MERIDKILIAGRLISPCGTEEQDIFNPTTGQVIGQVVLGNEIDVELAFSAAKAAFKVFS